MAAAAQGECVAGADKRDVLIPELGRL